MWGVLKVNSGSKILIAILWKLMKTVLLIENNIFVTKKWKRSTETKEEKFAQLPKFHLSLPWPLLSRILAFCPALWVSYCRGGQSHFSASQHITVSLQTLQWALFTFKIKSELCHSLRGPMWRDLHLLLLPQLAPASRTSLYSLNRGRSLSAGRLGLLFLSGSILPTGVCNVAPHFIEI